MTGVQADDARTIGLSGAPGCEAVPIDDVGASAYTIPTEQPESDGTLEWDATTLVLAEVTAGGRRGIGYTYGTAAAAQLITEVLGPKIEGRDALAVRSSADAMVHAVRNIGRPGVAAQAISAVDVALWDLKARLLDVPVVVALDAVHDRTPIYGSGGFCSYSLDQLGDQLAGWVAAGIPRVKMKVGRDPDDDARRLAAARRAIGDEIDLYVDANGAYDRKQALAWAQRFADARVRWLEEPLSSDDLEGLRLVRDRGPAGLTIAAGEYGYTPTYFERMLAAGAVDCLQADVTRCGGFSGFVAVGALCDAHHIDCSAHCAPQISAHACTAVPRLRHLEYFHDHVRIEHLLFDGVLEPTDDGALVPDRSRPGLGLELKRSDAERWRVA